MEDKRYPQRLFDADCERLRNMDLDHDVRIEKGNALAHLFLDQNNEEYIDPFAIADQRTLILGKE